MGGGGEARNPDPGADRELRGETAEDDPGWLEALVGCRRTPYPVPCLLLPCLSVYYTYCTTSNVYLYTTPVSTSVDTAVSIVFSNTVRTERSEDRHRMTPIGVLRHEICWGPGSGSHFNQPTADLALGNFYVVVYSTYPIVCVYIA